MRRARVGALLLAPALLLAACTSGNEPDASSNSPSTPPTSATPTTTPTVATTPSTSPVAASTTATASPSASATTSPRESVPTFTTTCRSLSVRVLKGGGIRGREIAAMQFVNDGTTACTITGTPTARLTLSGATIGTPSRPNGAKVRPFTIAPGDYGESLLRIDSTCEAPLSDHLQLQLPTRNGRSGRTITQPVELRACRIEVAPAGEPA